MSNFVCEVVPVELTPHPNADSLSCVSVWGYNVIVRSDDWQGVDRGVYIPVDSVVPDRPEWAFLEGHRRIRAKKLRGIFSQGMLAKIPADTLDDSIGADLSVLMEITKYEPPEKGFNSGRWTGLFADQATPPSIEVPKYTDIEHLRRYESVLEPGEQVIVTEKIHGANAKYVWCDNELHVGSMRFWRKNETSNPWWAVVTPEFAEFLKIVSPMIVYGEIYGSVQDLSYGVKDGGVQLRVFDIFNPLTFQYLDYYHMKAICETAHIPLAPEIWQMPFDLENIANVAEQDSLVGGKGHIMEGVVVRPVKERWDKRVGRVLLKLHSKRYLLRREA